MGFVFFLEKNKNLYFKKKQKISDLKKQKNRWAAFFLKQIFSTLIVFQSFVWFSLDRTIWNMSRHYQYGWVCAAHRV